MELLTEKRNLRAKKESRGSLCSWLIRRFVKIPNIQCIAQNHTLTCLVYFLEGISGRALLPYGINSKLSSCVSSGRQCATAPLFQRAAAAQHTPRHCSLCCYGFAHLPYLVAASHCNPDSNQCYRNGQGFQHRNLHQY